MKRKVILLLVSLFSASLYAQYGGIPFETLHKTIGAAALGMGEACVASPSGATMIFWTPAALDSINKNEIYAGAELLYEGAHMEYVSYSTPIGKVGGFGLMAGYLGYGSYEITDSNDVASGNTDMKDIFLTAAYGKNIIAGYQAGLAMKMLVKSTVDGTYPAFNADLSFYKSYDMFDAAITFKNILPLVIKYDIDSEKFVSTVKFGAAFKLLESNLRIEADVEKYFIKENPVFFLGAQYKLFDMLYLRAGYNTFAELSGGIGVGYQDINFDYTATFSEAALTHKMALSYAFGGYEVAVKAEPDVFSPVGSVKKIYLRATAKTKFEIYKWSLELKNRKGEVVRKWYGAGAPDTEITWDGLRADGMPFEEGDYRAVLTIVDENDNTIKSKAILIKIQTNDQKALPMFNE